MFDLQSDPRELKNLADLWALPATITRRKIIKRVEYYRAEKRGRAAEERIADDRAP